jgi:hypothetical protein
MLSDIQVTLSDGRRIDVLRKTYPVGPFIAMGFAGSVRLGFELVESMARHLRVPQDAPRNVAWVPQLAAQTWQVEAQRVFASAPPAEQELGSQTLLVGVHPTEDIGIPGQARAYVIRMVSPSFAPGFSPRRLVSVLSIGSGSRVWEYRRAVRDLFSTSRRPVARGDTVRARRRA